MFCCEDTERLGVVVAFSLQRVANEAGREPLTGKN